jgi:hypothetical protein
MKRLPKKKKTVSAAGREGGSGVKEGGKERGQERGQEGGQ